MIKFFAPLFVIIFVLGLMVFAYKSGFHDGVLTERVTCGSRNTMERLQQPLP